jgi:predicted enzyme related to lactoylglutathione lyase
MKTNQRTFAWIAAITACLTLSLAIAQQTPATAVDKVPADKALKMLGTAVPVTNLDRSLAFYTKGLGMQMTMRMERPDVVEVPLTFPGGGPYLILLWSKAATTTTPASTPSTRRVILDVPDLKSLESQLKANGYQFKGPINEIAQYHSAVALLDDPDGNHFELVQRSQ